MKKFKHLIQKLLGIILSEPIILRNKTIGYSLVKSQLHACNISNKSKLCAPYYLDKVKLSDYSYLSKNSNVTNTFIGKFCSIGPNFNCGLGLHPVDTISTSPMFYSTLKQNGFSLVNENKFEEFKPICIGNDVYIGANVTVLDGVNIGDGAIIGAGAVVTKDIPPFAIAVGVPAKVIKFRFEKKIINKLQKLQWWNLSDSNLKDIEKYLFNVEKYIEKLKTNKYK